MHHNTSSGGRLGWVLGSGGHAGSFCRGVRLPAGPSVSLPAPGRSPGSARSACPASTAPRSIGSCDPGSPPWPAVPASSGGGGRTCGPVSDAAAWCRASRCSLQNRVNTGMPAVSTARPGWLRAQGGCASRLSSTSPYPQPPASHQAFLGQVRTTPDCAILQSLPDKGDGWAPADSTGKRKRGGGRDGDLGAGSGTYHFASQLPQQWINRHRKHAPPPPGYARSSVAWPGGLTLQAGGFLFSCGV